MLQMVKFNTDGIEINDTIGRIALNKGHTRYIYNIRPQSLVNDCRGGCSIILDNATEKIVFEGVTSLKDRGFIESAIKCYYDQDEPNWLVVIIGYNSPIG